MIGLISFAITCAFQKTSWRDVSAQSIAKLLGPSLVIYLEFFHKKFFSKWCDEISILTQAVIVFAMAAQSVELEDYMHHGPLFLLIRHTPVIPLFLSPILHPTNYWTQFWAQAIISMASYIWTCHICSNRLISSELCEGIDTILVYLQAWFVTIFVPGPKKNFSVYSCRVLVGFAHYLVGFMLPCALKYISESQARAKYLAARFPPRAWQSINYAYWENVRCCGCLTVLSLVTVLLMLPTFKA